VQKNTGDKQIFIKTVLVWVGIVLLGAFWLTVRGSLAPVGITAMPELPRAGEPVLVTFKLNNPRHETRVTDYQFYADGKLLKEGQAAIDPRSGKTYQYAYTSPAAAGERVAFTVKAGSGGESYEKTVSIPPFPPQACSSFISFASFSTTVMSSLATSPYYKDNFAATAAGVNAGLVIFFCLIALLIAMELAGAAAGENDDPTAGPPAGGLVILQRFRLKFSTLTWILFIIFIGIVYTKIVMILSMTWHFTRGLKQAASLHYQRVG